MNVIPIRSSSEIRFALNGREVELEVRPEALLLDVLRDRLQQKGAKRSCDMQVCGACTVLVDGAPVSACTYLAIEAHGRELTTVEGLGSEERLDPLQEAFVDAAAVQCGFCTAGMLLTAKALLAEEPSPTRARAIHDLRGNLCRCTGYKKILDAILLGGGLTRFAGRASPTAPASSSEGASMAPSETSPITEIAPAKPALGEEGPLRVVGKSVRRTDAVEKVTGRARYLSDMEIAGMAHARILRSPYPHARIARIDVTRARALSGVYAVLTGADLTWCDPFFGPALRDRPVLAIDVARHEGEPVVAVAAVDEATAAEALDLVEVDYEDRPAVMTIEEALAPGAPLVHTDEPLAGHFSDLASLRAKRGTNICHQFDYRRGDGESAFAGADLVVEDVYTFPRVQHYSMEPHGAIAEWDAEGGLTVWSSTQNPFSVRAELAKLFDLPQSRIRVAVPLLGGGFGGKTYAKLEPVAAALARVARRPVKLQASVEDAFHTVRRCSARVRVRLGFHADGRLLALSCDADFDVGAYADIAPRVIQKGTYTASGPYRVANVLLHSNAVYTNTTPGGAFRGFGVPQIVWAVESLMDVAAERLDRDPVDLRRQNLLAHGEEFARGDTPVDGKLEESLDRVAEAIRWQAGAAAGRAKGVAAMLKASVAPSVSEAVVRLHADGSASVLASTVEMGQGARTVLAQIAAEVLAIPLERVTVVSPDTGITPYDQTTSSSRSTTMVGRAVQEAASDVIGQLVRIAAELTGRGAPRESGFHAEDGAIVGGGRRMTYPELLDHHFGMRGGELIGRGVVAPGRTKSPLGGSTPFWEVAMGGAEISLDAETGAISVEAYASVADVGRRINPQQCEAQDEGAVVQGIGHTLLEEMVYEGGALLNANLVDYRVPRAEDVPPRLESLFVENGDGPGPFGAKGVGEGSLIPVSPAIANALARLAGVRMTELPLTPERVWRALRDRDQSPKP
jgi:CO/xanthine dehydrogenase Mo-binding subunit/aerobic-type carbon monoxide dehydrogenase small subunit (CoxS/CutS family)